MARLRDVPSCAPCVETLQQRYCTYSKACQKKFSRAAEDIYHAGRPMLLDADVLAAAGALFNVHRMQRQSWKGEPFSCRSRGLILSENPQSV